MFKTGNGIIQTGNGIIPCTSRPSDQKPLVQNVSYFASGAQHFFFKTGNRIIKTGNGIIII